MSRNTVMSKAMDHFIRSTNEAERDGKIDGDKANRIRLDGIELLGRICGLVDEYAMDMGLPQSSTCYVLASALIGVINIYPDNGSRDKAAQVAARFLLDSIESG